MNEEKVKSNKIVEKFLEIIENVGNKLPHPTTLFALFAAGVIVVSWIVSFFDFSVIHPGTGNEIRPVSLLSIEGLHRIILNLVTNFTSFAPLGTVLVSLLGIAVAEHSGLIGTALRLLVLKAPKKLLTFVIVFPTSFKLASLCHLQLKWFFISCIFYFPFVFVCFYNECILRL